MKNKYKERLFETPQMASECGLSKGTLRKLRRKCGENLGFPRSRGGAAKAAVVQGLRPGCPLKFFAGRSQLF